MEIQQKLPSLNDLANFFGTDKGDKHFEAHNYAHVYEKYLGEFRDDYIRYVEIGINDPRFPLASAHMWNTYFPNGRYHGIDINLGDLRRFYELYPHAKIYYVDQTNASQLADFAEETCAYRFIVDDGIHTHEAQMTSFNVLFPYLLSGGYYFIEDCHAKDCGKTIEFFKNLQKFLPEEGNEKYKKVEFYNNDKLIVITKQ